jgi:hypothetical protein
VTSSRRGWDFLAIQGICNADRQHSSPEACNNQTDHYQTPVAGAAGLTDGVRDSTAVKPGRSPPTQGSPVLSAWADTTKSLCRLDETALQQKPAIGTRVLQGKW